MKQFEQEMVRGHLHKRRASGMAETSISLGDQVAELVVGKSVAYERAHDGIGDLLIRLPRHRGDLIMAQGGNGFWHIKAAIPGKTCQHRVFEGQDRSLSASRNIAHVRRPFGEVCER